MRRAVVTIVFVALGCVSCTSTPATGPKGIGSTSTSTTLSTNRPSRALDDLTAFFTAGAEIDQELKAAADDANGGIGTTQITISQSTLDGIAAADPTPAEKDIPAGLFPSVMLPVLTVQSDLVSRYWAFRGVVQAQPGAIPRANPMPGTLSAADYLLLCLGNGSKAASSFSADVAAARAAASQTPAVEPVDPSSQAAADLAIWLHYIIGSNSGCMECGGSRFTALLPITWHSVAALTPGGNGWDGDIAGGLFAAHYTPGQGWTVQFNAC